MVDSLIKHFRFPLTVRCSAKFQRGCFPANSLWIKEEREREREPSKESEKKGRKARKKARMGLSMRALETASSEERSEILQDSL